MEAHVRHLEDKYKQCEREECRWESYRAEDAEVLLVGYGIVSRVLRSTVDLARRAGGEGGTVPSDFALAVPLAGTGGGRQGRCHGDGG